MLVATDSQAFLRAAVHQQGMLDTNAQSGQIFAPSRKLSNPKYILYYQIKMLTGGP